MIKSHRRVQTHYKYINSEEERTLAAIHLSKEPADDSIPWNIPELRNIWSRYLQRITLLVGTLLFAWSLLMPYKWAVKSGFYRFYTKAAL